MAGSAVPLLSSPEGGLRKEAASFFAGPAGRPVIVRGLSKAGLCAKNTANTSPNRKYLRIDEMSEG